MQAVEALTLLISMGDQSLKLNASLDGDNPQLSEYEKQLQLAVSVCQAMLNTALPVARFRCFVQIESGREKGREYTICGVNIEDIVTALYPLSLLQRNVYVSLWEQRATGADMIEGYQGPTRGVSKPQFRMFLDSLRKYSVSTLAN